MAKNHLRNFLLPDLERLGGQSNADENGQWSNYEYLIDTPFGPLYISPENRSGRGRRACVSHIHGRFDNAYAARDWTGGQVGGKWNHYASEPSEAGCRALARHFLDLLAAVLADTSVAA